MVSYTTASIEELITQESLDPLIVIFKFIEIPVPIGSLSVTTKLELFFENIIFEMYKWI